MSQTISDDDATRMREEIDAALREGIAQDDPVIMILVSPAFLKDFHRRWDEWDLHVEVKGKTVRAAEFITIADSDRPLGDERYVLVTRSENEQNFLLRHYGSFLVTIRRSPVQVTVDDLRQLYIQERLQQFRREEEQGGQ
ncbi:MAG: hypothetical protein ACE5JM_14290 [Armatimonadota bacterium]